MAGTKIPHFNYIGDSIIGTGCNFGAGTKIANLRHDHANVRVCGKDTRRKKFGAVIGDGVQFGINCSVNVGTLIGSNAQFAPNSFYFRVHRGECNYPVGESMQAVILAAGEGKRVRPLTRSRPKAIIPVANRPIIEYVIEALLKNGIRDIIVVVGYRKEQVTRYLNQLEIPVEVVVQNKQLGTAHALKCAESHIKGDFLLLPGDNYIDHHSIGRIKEIKNAMLVKEHPSPSNFGVVLLKDGFVSGIIEKPEHSPSFMVSTGIYSLTKDFFLHIRENNITDAVSSMLASGEKLQAIIAEDWQDAIYPWDLLKMNKRLLKDLHGLREGTSSRQTIIQGTVSMGKGSIIGPGTLCQVRLSSGMIAKLVLVAASCPTRVSVPG